MNNERFLGLNRQQLYWSCQLGGWLLFVFLQALFLSLKNQLSSEAEAVLFVIFIAGILFTQTLRFIIIRAKWLNKPFLFVIPQVLICSLLLGAVTALVKSFTEHTLLKNADVLQADRVFTDGTNFSLFFFFWSIIYFLVHFIENYKRSEIEKLKWEAAISEAELNKLKSQLNPHFMFNAMNSIRALVGENPAKAKEAVTQFSNLMRNTLQMGKQKFVPLSQEMEVVKDYLAIESVRLEERLRLELDINEGCSSFEVPPLMIQTLVENGIKHGIAKLAEGGRLKLRIDCADDKLCAVITNSGKYDAALKPESGFGLKNTKERLQLLYNGNADFNIENKNNEVVTTLMLPKKQS